MKASISNRIYLNCDKGSRLERQLMEELKYEISQMPVSEYPLIINNFSRVTQGVVSIPSGRVDLIPKDYEIIDKRVQVPVDLPTPGFTLRDNQKEAVDFIEGHSGLINAKPSWGKTIAGYGLAHRLQQKTLIITTTTNIRDMWIAEARKWFGIEPGIIGGGKFNIDSPIVIGNIQTIRNRTELIKDEFGLVIVDEVHRCPAKTFTDVLNTLRAKFKVGLSGTLERKDGKHCVLQDYFGHKLFKANDENRLPPTIHLWDSGYELSSNEFIPWANLMTKLQGDPLYREQMLKLVLMYAELGHKVLFLSDRKDILNYLHEQTSDISLIITGEVKDNRPEILREISDLNSIAKILYGTLSIFAEGVSAEGLSCVILGTPTNNDPLIEQVAGRVMRKMEGKLDPIVVDVGMSGNTGKRHRNARLSLYTRMGWKVKQMGNIT